MASFDTVINAVKARLANVAPFAIGKAEIARNVDPPRFVWLRLGISPSTRKPTAGGLQEDAYENEVHCEAKSAADAEAMRDALIQAVRLEMKGANYRTARSTWDEPDDAKNGIIALVVPLTLFVQMPRVNLPEVASGPPATSVTPNVPGEVQLTDVEIDGSGATTGDGELQGGETP